MRASRLATALITVALGTGLAAEAGPYWSSFWGLDGHTVWTPATFNYTVPTGYWGYGWGYNWGPYSWGPNLGWWTPYSGYYNSYSWWGWHGGPYFGGFTDYYTYSYTGFVPRTVYTWSRYWDPDGIGNTLDVYTTASDDGSPAQPFSPDIISQVSINGHAFSINGGYDTGQFTSLQWVQATPAALEDYLMTHFGMSLIDADAIIGEMIFQNLIDYNLAHGGGYVIGLQEAAAYHFPEPSAALLALLGGTVLLRRR